MSDEPLLQYESVKYWADRIRRPSTRAAYLYDLQLFCRWCGKTPDQLLLERKNSDGNQTLDLLENFIIAGEVKAQRVYKSGKLFERLIKIAELRKKRKERLFYAIRSFFKKNKAALPEDDFQIKDTVSKAGEAKVTYMSLDEAKTVIGGSKTPYRELFTAMMYSGMGVGEVAELNNLWGSIRKQLAEGREVIRLDFSYRKGNENPFFTLVPRKVFEKYREVEEQPFVTNSKPAGTPVSVYALDMAWRNARKRSGMVRPVKAHMFRDLLLTDGITECKIDSIYLDFLAGHRIDKDRYKQLYEKPAAVQAEWLKWMNYVDRGSTDERWLRLDSELQERDKRIRELETQLEKSLGVMTWMTPRIEQMTKDMQADRERVDKLVDWKEQDRMAEAALRETKSQKSKPTRRRARKS